LNKNAKIIFLNHQAEELSEESNRQSAPSLQSTCRMLVNIEMMMQSLEGYFSIISELLELEPDQL
jgi:hypothetical protein